MSSYRKSLLSSTNGHLNMKARDLDLGSIWTSEKEDFSAAGTGEFREGNFQIKVFTDRNPYSDFLMADMLRFPSLHLNNTLNSGSLLDAMNTNASSSMKGFTALTFQGSDFIKGVFVESREEPLGKVWSIVSPSLRPMRTRPWGESHEDIPKIEFKFIGGELVLEHQYSKSASQRQIIQNYSHMMTFTTTKEISIAEFLNEYAGPTLAFLKIAWQRPLGAEEMNVRVGNGVGEIFSPYFEEQGNERGLDSWNSLIFDTEMNWGLWFDFCLEHRNVVMLLADLASGGTGYLQNQILNACIVLEDLGKINHALTSISPEVQDTWAKARRAAVLAAGEFGLGQFVSNKLQKKYPVALGKVATYVSNLIREFDLEFSDPDMTGRVILGARNPVAHTSKSSDDFREMLTVLRGMTSLAIVGLFNTIFGPEIAGNAAEKLKSKFRDFEVIIPEIVARDFGEHPLT